MSDSNIFLNNFWLFQITLIPFIYNYLLKNNSLTSLNFSDCENGHLLLASLTKKLKSDSKLKSLTLSKVGLSSDYEDDIDSFAKTIEQTGISILSLTYNNLNKGDLHSLTSHLRKKEIFLMNIYN